MNCDLDQAWQAVVEGCANPAQDDLVAAAIADDPALEQTLLRDIAVAGLLSQLAPPDRDTAAGVRECLRSAPQNEAFANDVRRRLTPRRRPARANRSLWIGPLVAAALVVLTVLLQGNDPTPQATAPGLRLLDSPTDQLTMLLVGDEIVCAAHESVTLGTDDGSRFRLEGPAQARVIDNGGGPSLALVHGVLTCEISPQPSSGPAITVRGAQSAVHVLGTRFQIHSSEDHDRVACNHGLIRVERLQQPLDHVLVRPGQHVIVGQDRPLEVVDEQAAALSGRVVIVTRLQTPLPGERQLAERIGLAGAQVELVPASSPAQTCPANAVVVLPSSVSSPDLAHMAADLARHPVFCMDPSSARHIGLARIRQDAWLSSRAHSLTPTAHLPAAFAALLPGTTRIAEGDTALGWIEALPQHQASAVTADGNRTCLIVAAADQQYGRRVFLGLVPPENADKLQLTEQGWQLCITALQWLGSQP